MAKAPTKFTFKKEPRETGLRGVGNPRPNTIIKLNKQQVGIIYAPNWRTPDNLWTVRLIKKDETQENCGWKWVTLKQRFGDEPTAREHLNKHFDAIIALGLTTTGND